MQIRHVCDVTNLYIGGGGLDNMRDPGILDPRHFFFPRHFFQRCKVTGELTAEINVKCLGKCGRKMTLIARHFFMKISKVPGNVQMQRTLLCQALFMDI